MRHRGKKSGVFAVSFAAGLLLSVFCPAKVVTAILAIALIVVGISYLKA